MDGLTPFPRVPEMPPRFPLACPVQDFHACHEDSAAPGWPRARRVWLWRAAAFVPAAVLTVLLVWAFADWLSNDGMWWLEWVLTSLVAITFFWIALSVGTATVGLFRLVFRRRRPAPAAPRGLEVALLMPVFNEDPVEVFGNACAMMTALARAPTRHTFELYVLSDTQDDSIAAAERAAFAMLRDSLPPGAAVWYRRRARNTDRKSGNIAQFLEAWGGRHAAMVVLDADSLMSAGALIRLSDELAADPSAGLIQSSPLLVGSDTLFGRAQQFSTVVYGRILSEGLAGWTEREGNYWGHNAILRTRAFAACAGLPRLSGLLGRDRLIMSHDFVEAGLLRRAGWAVRFMPSVTGSFEQPPATLIDYALRDRRWCHGNLQHLRLLAARGFHPVTRFHLFQGAMSYLLSPVWFGLLVIWALLGNGPDSVITYFSAENPLYPVWPEMSPISSVLILMFMYGMLLAPKIMGAAAVSFTGIRVETLGGWRWFALSLPAEIAIAILFAPVLMVQQVVAVLRVLSGTRPVWSPQARKGGDYSLWTTMKFHALETASGLLLMAGMAVGSVSLWLVPIAVSLVFAVPLSLLSGVDLRRWRATRRLMTTPEQTAPPPIVQLAGRCRQMFRDMPARRLAAE